MAWLETYRGTVYRWEVDPVDHFTVAFYFARLEDATQALLHRLGLNPTVLAAAGQACVTREAQVRYRRELRVGDVLHIRSGVLEIEDHGLLIAHEVIDSEDGTLCTTVAERVELVDRSRKARRRLAAKPREAALSHRVQRPAETDERAGPPPPAGDEGFVDAARDAVRPVELNALGEAGMPAYVHRFTAANGHVLAAFGMTPSYCRREHRGFSTFVFDLRFSGWLRGGDLVRVRSGLVHVGSSSMRIFHRLSNAATGELVATLEQAGVHLDLDARRPAPLPPELRARAQAMVVKG